MASVMYGRVKDLAQGTSTDHAIVLGHIIAHEIGHLLLSRDAHSIGGIMSATLNTQFAARGLLWFSPAEAAVARVRVAGLVERHDTFRRAAAVRSQSMTATETMAATTPR